MTQKSTVSEMSLDLEVDQAIMKLHEARMHTETEANASPRRAFGGSVDSVPFYRGNGSMISSTKLPFGFNRPTEVPEDALTKRDIAAHDVEHFGKVTYRDGHAVFFRTTSMGPTPASAGTKAGVPHTAGLGATSPTGSTADQGETEWERTAGATGATNAQPPRPGPVQILPPYMLQGMDGGMSGGSPRGGRTARRNLMSKNKPFYDDAKNINPDSRRRLMKMHLVYDGHPLGKAIPATVRGGHPSEGSQTAR